VFFAIDGDLDLGIAALPYSTPKTFPKLPHSQIRKDPPTPYPHFYFGIPRKRKIGSGKNFTQTDFLKFPILFLLL